MNLLAQRNAYKNEFDKALNSVLNSGVYVGGKAINELESNLAKFCMVKHAITCASGTDALTIALMALDIKPKDEIIVPDFTFIAPAECVYALGGIPIFADIHPKTLQISPESVEKLITKKTRGIIAVDLFGQLAPFEQLKKIAKKYNLWIIEDGAQAFGAKTKINNPTKNEIQNLRSCSFGTISITSFYPSKPLGCYGDGGALFTNDDNLAEKIKAITNHGSKIHYLHEIIGINSRLDSIQAAILSVKLKHLTKEIKVRQNNAKLYNQFFKNYVGITPQSIANGNTSTYAQYTLIVDNRECFIKKLENKKIPYCIHYPKPLHNQPCFNKLLKKSYIKNNAEILSNHVISLPICAFTNVQQIINQLRSIL